jgi:hypothetical protein
MMTTVLSRYEIDVTVRCAILCWPAIDPLGRYHHAKKRKEEGKPRLADEVLPGHDAYWPDEAASRAAIGKIIDYVHREIR